MRREYCWPIYFYLDNRSYSLLSYPLLSSSFSYPSSSLSSTLYMYPSPLYTYPSSLYPLHFFLLHCSSPHLSSYLLSPALTVSYNHLRLQYVSLPPPYHIFIFCTLYSILIHERQLPSSLYCHPSTLLLPIPLVNSYLSLHHILHITLIVYPLSSSS